VIEQVRTPHNAGDALGVALPAIIQNDAVTYSAFSLLTDTSIRRDLQSALSMPVSVHNIGESLAAQACRTGAATGAHLAVAMWIGNSCHGGLAIDGQPVTGAHGAAANWPHLQLPAPVPHELDGRVCWCGRSGCLESFLSTAGLEGDYQRVTGEWRAAADITCASANSDIVADSVIQVFEDRLGRATATIISLFDPDVIVLGGTFVNLPRLCERLPRKWPGYVQVDRSKTRLVGSEGGIHAVTAGAAMLAADTARLAGS
jgi:predicted NBD/HSP70 family sugar kinase